MSEPVALIGVDIQNCFCPGGSLAVPGGDQIVPVFNQIARTHSLVVLTQDWHPPGHFSFASSHPGKTPFDKLGDQVLWPDHAVQGTPGAELHPALDVPHAQLIIRKGCDPEYDSYSAFFDAGGRTTGLGAYLRDRGVSRVVIAGLATDFCVRATAVDAARLGLKPVVAVAACRAIDADGSLAAAMAEMRQAGVEMTG